MADNYKILAQTTAASVEEISGVNQANVVYTVPENTQASVSSISLVNTSANAEEYYLGVVKAEASLSQTTEVSAQTIPKILVVANGEDESIFSNKYSYSTDGSTWIPGTLPASEYWSKAIYGNGIFLIVASPIISPAATYVTSTDGITWTLRSLPLEEVFNQSAIFANGRFIVFAQYSPDFVFSEDGENWSSVLSIDSSGSGVQDSVYGNGKIVALRSGTTNIVSYSYDGENWFNASLPFSKNFDAIAVSDSGLFVALGQSESRTVYSLDGEQWLQGSIGYSHSWSTIAYGNGKFVAVSSGVNNWTSVSEDGVSWSEPVEIPNPLSTFRLFSNMVYAEGKFILAQAESTTAWQSLDGQTWEAVEIYSISPGSNITWKSMLSANTPETIIQAQAILNSATIIPTRSIEPNQVDEIVGGITLSAGDQIRVYSESEDLIVQVYGVEIE